MIGERSRHDVSVHNIHVSAAQAEEWARSLIACVRRGLCAARGHDVLLRLEPRRLSLRCLNCGWESSGWTIDRPRFSFANDQSRQSTGRTLNRLERRQVGRGASSAVSFTRRAAAR